MHASYQLCMGFNQTNPARQTLFLLSPGEPSLTAVLIIALSVSSSSHSKRFRSLISSKMSCCSSRKAVHDRSAMALLTSVTILLYVLSSPLQSNLIDFFFYGYVLLVLLPPCFCSSVPSVLFRVALSLSLAPMLFSARKSTIASSSSKNFLLCVTTNLNSRDL